METILVVDDEPDVCELARDCLVAAGYRVLEATDGEEALRIAEAQTGPIHLLLTDVVMPVSTASRWRASSLAAAPTRRCATCRDSPLLAPSSNSLVGLRSSLEIRSFRSLSPPRP